MHQYKILSLFLLLIFGFYPYEGDAAVKLPTLVSNGMVLQHDMPRKIWNLAYPSENIKVDFREDYYKTTADKNGTWQFELPVMVWNPGVSNPTAVRYAWDDNPGDANLKNRAGLPGSPFTTEN